MKKLLAVDKRDKVLREVSWQDCHREEGLLHRGFTILVIDDKNEILLQKRSKQKPLWPLFWDGCSSHPRKGESYVQAGERRLKEEMGFTCDLRYLLKFEYHIKYKDKGSENEICVVLLGKYDGEVRPDPKEVADYRFIGLSDLKKEIGKKPEIFAPWFKMAFEKIRKDKNLKGLFG